MKVVEVIAESVVGGHHTQTWDLVSSASSLNLWRANVVQSGEWVANPDDLADGHPSDELSLFDTSTPYRWIDFDYGRGLIRTVVEVTDTLPGRYIEWQRRLEVDADGTPQPVIQRHTFRITVEPAASESRVRLRSRRQPRSAIEAAIMRAKKASAQRDLVISLGRLNDLLVYG